MSASLQDIMTAVMLVRQQPAGCLMAAAAWILQPVHLSRLKFLQHPQALT
jgi:hypothetical protein